MNTAHKFTVSQGISIHNDNPGHPGLGTHRIVYLNEAYNDEQGGHLVLFNSENKTDIHRILRPLNNTFFGFAASRNSYHAVTTIKESLRFTINLSFIDDRFTQAEQNVFQQLTGISVDDGLDIYKFFIQNRAKHTSHSGRTAWGHFIGTANVLTNLKALNISSSQASFTVFMAPPVPILLTSQ